MNLYELNKYLNSKDKVLKKIKEFEKEKKLLKVKVEKEEIEGHLLKAEHNLLFIKDVMKLKYFDWAIVGCYYASYHAALALIMTKGYYSKSHLATLLILIKEFYKDKLTEEDLKTFAKFLDYKDITFYVRSKNEREKASYSSNLQYTKKEVEDLRLKTLLFVNKIEEIIKD